MSGATWSGTARNGERPSLRFPSAVAAIAATGAAPSGVDAGMAARETSGSSRFGSRSRYCCSVWRPSSHTVTTRVGWSGSSCTDLVNTTFGCLSARVMVASSKDSVPIPLGADEPNDFFFFSVRADANGASDDDDDAEDDAEDREEDGDDEEENDSTDAIDDSDDNTDAPDRDRRYSEATDARDDASDADDDVDDDTEDAPEDSERSADRVFFFVSAFWLARSILRAQRFFVPRSCASYTSPNEPCPNLRINLKPQHHMPA